MTLRDWRDVDPDVLAPVYEAERARWMRVLQWDAAAAWREVEQARTSWGLPGFAALDDAGHCAGLAFYLPEADRIDVGGLAARDVGVTDALLDAMLGAAEASGATTIRAMLFEGAPALASGLRVRGFDVEPYLSLSRSFGPVERRSCSAAAARPDLGTWLSADTAPAAALLRRAYDRPSGAVFAPHDDPAEWDRYVGNIVTHVGCGVLNPEATVVHRQGAAMRAIALVTDISPRVAHLVQLAVDPAGRRRGVGRALLNETCERLAAREYSALTLLVASSNLPARALYESLGFRQDATFLSAWGEGNLARSNGKGQRAKVRARV
jgi:ribosomal protein S18 acetylase RimI-like enzyme